MAETEIAPEVTSFLVEHIDSVLALELLLLLRREPKRAFTGMDLANALKIDAVRAAEQLAHFHQRGLLSRSADAPPAYHYAPQTPTLDAAVTAVASAYASHRVTMIGLIFSKPTSTLKTFADAFRIRKDRPDHG